MTELFKDCLIALSKICYEHRANLIMSIAAALLLIYGDNIMFFVKRQTKTLNFFLRVTSFVLMAGVGLVFLQWVLTELIAPMILAIINPHYHFLLYVILFTIIGILAERKRQI